MLSNYFKVAIKVLMRRKFYTFVSLFGIAFTLLILNLVVAMMDYTLAPAKPESRLDRILTIKDARLSGESWSSSSSAGYKLLDQYARDLPGVEMMSIISDTGSVTAYIEGEKVTPQFRRTDGKIWQILDYEFLEGGPYTEDDVRSGHFHAVINETTRKRFFGDSSAIGKSIALDDQSFLVVGVVRDVAIMRQVAFSEIWVPLTTAKSTSYREQLIGGMVGVILAESPAMFDGIRSELERRLVDAQLPEPDRFDKLEAGAFTRYEHIARGMFDAEDPTSSPTTGRLTLIIALLALLFMTLPALNLVNLSLSRILERASEIGVRKAFGASSLTLVGQFMIEAILLTLLGSAASLILTAIALRIIGNSDLIPYADLSLNLRSFLFGVGIALVFAFVSGAYPAWRMSRLHPVEALHGRSS
jgi:putative ABC transport system permease protein